MFFCKQKTAYEMRISDWSSDVCSSDLHVVTPGHDKPVPGREGGEAPGQGLGAVAVDQEPWKIREAGSEPQLALLLEAQRAVAPAARLGGKTQPLGHVRQHAIGNTDARAGGLTLGSGRERHTPELRPQMRTPYAAYW